MTDFINLTFCCQQATVITDFSDLDAVGRQHYMTLEGGCASEEELEQVDGRAAALKLILNKHGTITPYGVVYDNGMELEKFYKEGGPFPDYLDREFVILLEHPTARGRAHCWFCRTARKGWNVSCAAPASGTAPTFG